ncbi:MAG: cell division protein FtsB [Legionellales bacterium]|nr:cell division protein FtsB [Legionellales bacterium]|tara:strand:- start:1533 stop:1817 length:285 start_codon:yes stop_codon:yes gene_type:complete
MRQVVLAGLLVLCLLALQQRIWMSSDGVPVYMELQSEISEQQEQIKLLEKRNRVLIAEVADLKSQLIAVEERARNDLGMIKPNETFYFVTENGL